ncbi:cation transporter [Methylocystis echinoides]|uniref:cation transporter n=1 Tax=Methylocystis echinoides TaxID=29468 RepID=UPI000F91C537|nr:MAG: cation transporter [Hyphomicrobiales bacterium]
MGKQDHPHTHAPRACVTVWLRLRRQHGAQPGARRGELAFGFLSNSLALISHGAHNFSGVVGLLLAWGGSWLASRQPSPSRTYGYRRASVLAALGNTALPFMATGAVIIEAAQRLTDQMAPQMPVRCRQPQRGGR